MIRAARRIGLDQLPDPIESEVRTGNVIDQFLHDRREGPDALEYGHFCCHALGSAEIRFAGRGSVQPKLGHPRSLVGVRTVPSTWNLSAPGRQRLSPFRSPHRSLTAATKVREVMHLASAPPLRTQR